MPLARRRRRSCCRRRSCRRCADGRLVDRLRERVREAGRGRRRRAGCRSPRPRAPSGATPTSSAREPVEVGRRRAARRRGGRSAARTLTSPSSCDVARDGRLDDVVAGLAQRRGELGLRRERLLADEAQDRALALAAVHAMRQQHNIVDEGSRCLASTSSGRRRSSGGVRRSAVAAGGEDERGPRRGRRRRPARRAGRARAPSSRPAPRTSSTPGRTRARRRAARRGSRTFASSSSSTRLDDRAGGGADDRVAAERRGVVAGREAAGGASSATSSAPIGRPLASALRERDEIRPDAELLEGEERARAAHAGLDLVEAEERAVLGGELGGGVRAKPGSSGMTPPSPSTGSSRISAGVRADGRLAATRCRSAARSGRPGSERLERARASPAGRSPRARPSVRPWKQPSSATTPGLPVALRAYLIAASFASAPELQKNACAPPKRSESRRGELAPSARSSRGSRRARAGRAAPARRRAAPGGGGRARRRRSRRRSRGSGARRRRPASSPRPRRR